MYNIKSIWTFQCQFHTVQKQYKTKNSYYNAVQNKQAINYAKNSEQIASLIGRPIAYNISITGRS